MSGVRPVIGTSGPGVNLALPVTNCVIADQSLSLLEPCCSHLYNGDHDHSFLQRSVCLQREMIVRSKSIWHVLHLLLLELAHQGCTPPPQPELPALSLYDSGGPGICIASSHAVVPPGQSLVLHLAVSPQGRNCVSPISEIRKICPHLVIFLSA